MHPDSLLHAPQPNFGCTCFAEPVWEAGGRAIGCRVAGFKSSPDGSAGQAERTGAVRPGDVLTGVGDVPVGDMSFEKVMKRRT